MALSILCRFSFGILARAIIRLKCYNNRIIALILCLGILIDTFVIRMYVCIVREFVDYIPDIESHCI